MVLVNFLTAATILVIHSIGTFASNPLPFAVNAPNIRIPTSDIDTWVAGHDLGLVLFCNEVNLAGDVAAVVGRFEKVGPQLNGYKIHFGVYDCSLDPTHERCSDQQSQAVVAAYLGGMYLVDISMDSLYDDFSILSNALQLLLIHEVPLLQSAEEFTGQMKSSVEKSSDFLIAFVKGIGTADHAHYMKLAKDSMDTDSIQLSFAHATTSSFISQFTNNSPTRKLAEELKLADDDSQLYYVKCSEVKSSEGVQCPIYQYTGGFDSSSLSNYVHLLTFDGQRAEAMELKLPMASCFYGNGEEQTQVKVLTRWLSEELKGAILVYSLSSEEASEEEAKLHKELGALCTIQDDKLGVQAMIELKLVQGYIVENVLVRRRELLKKQETDDAAEDEDAIAEAIITSVETVDDSLDIADDSLGGKQNLDLSNVVVLDRESFKTEVFSGVVLFHLMKYDHRSRIVLRLYNEAAANLTKGPLSVIDCYDWTDVCKKLNITEFPTIRLYSKGKYNVYNGPLTTQAFIHMSNVSKFNSPHTVDSMVDVMTLRKDLIKADVSLIVVGLFDSDKSKEYEAYEQVSRNLAGQYVMLVATDKKLAENVKRQFKLDTLPVIAMYNVSVKDMSQAVVRFDRKTYNSKTIQHFIQRSTLPSFMELTPTTLPLLQISRHPQVLFFTKELESEAFKVVQTLSADNSLKNKFGFNYLSLGDNSMNERILRALAGNVQSPALLVVDYTKGKIYTMDVEDSVNAKDTKVWMQQLSVGNIPSTKDLPQGEWKGTHPGYDYLELIEKDKNKQQKYEGDRLHTHSRHSHKMGIPAVPSDMQGAGSTERFAPEAPAAAAGGVPSRHTEL